jgi:hypothetical protein
MIKRGRKRDVSPSSSSGSDSEIIIRRDSPSPPPRRAGKYPPPPPGYINQVHKPNQGAPPPPPPGWKGPSIGFSQTPALPPPGWRSEPFPKIREVPSPPGWIGRPPSRSQSGPEIRVHPSFNPFRKPTPIVNDLPAREVAIPVPDTLPTPVCSIGYPTTQKAVVNEEVLTPSRLSLSYANRVQVPSAILF